MIVDFLKRIRENWQLLATLLITWSIFDLYNFYTPFGIEIQSYVNLGEILLLSFPAFLNGIIAILILTIIFLLIGIGIPKNRNLNVDLDDDNLELFKTKKKLRLLLNEFRHFKLKSIFGILMMFISIIGEIFLWVFVAFIGFGIYSLFKDNIIGIDFSNRSRFSLLLFVTVFFLTPIFLLSSALLEKKAHKSLSGLTIEKNPIVYFVIGFIINSLISNRVQYLAIINGNQEKMVSFLHSGNEIKTDSTLVYIGSTESYIFLRDNLNKQSIVFNKAQIENIKLQAAP